MMDWFWGEGLGTKILIVLIVGAFIVGIFMNSKGNKTNNKGQ